MISVIVPVYNNEATLPRTLDSILRADTGDMELLVVDDGSTDGSLAVAERFRDAHPDRAITVVATPHRGVSAARNAGLDRARGDRISFIDADDWIDPDFYKKLDGAMTAYDADYAFCRIINEYPKGEGATPMAPEGFACCDSDAVGVLRRAMLDLSVLDGHRVMNSVCNGLFDRGIIEKNGLRFDESVVYGEDGVFMLDYIRYVRRFCHTAEPLYHYVQRPDSSSHRMVGNLIEENRGEFQAYEARSRVDQVFSENFYRTIYAYILTRTMARIPWRRYDAAWMNRQLRRLDEWLREPHMRDVVRRVRYCDCIGFKQKCKWFLVRHRMYRTYYGICKAWGWLRRVLKREGKF